MAIFLITQAHGIMFYLEPNSHKCLKEEVHANVLVTGEYEVSEALGQKTDYVVSRSYYLICHKATFCLFCVEIIIGVKQRRLIWRP